MRSWLGFSITLLASSVEAGLNFVGGDGFARAEIAEKQFVVYEEMRFLDKPDLAGCGVRPIRVVYSAEMWPDEVLDEPDLAHLAALFQTLVGEPVVHLDVEHWQGDVNKFVATASLFRSILPKVDLGFYGIPPVRNFYAPVRGRDVEGWRAVNDQLSPIAAAVDLVLPSLYTFYHPLEGEYVKDEWVKYAVGNIAEAKQYGKRVVPYLWPSYHDSNGKWSGHDIDAEFWMLQLETVYRHADGVVIWSRATDASRWNKNAGWWRATREFLDSKGLSSKVCHDEPQRPSNAP